MGQGLQSRGVVKKEVLCLAQYSVTSGAPLPPPPPHLKVAPRFQWEQMSYTYVIYFYLQLYLTVH